MHTNIHVHLFTADHAPPAQLYHLLRGALHSAARDVLPKVTGRPLTTADIELLDVSMDRFEEPWPTLFKVAGLVGGLVDPRLLIGMLTQISRLDPEDGKAILRVGADMAESDMLKGIAARTDELANGPANSLTPFRDALCAVVAELYDAHEKSSAAKGPISQEEIWDTFIKNGPAPMYQRVVVLSVDMDEAFVNENLPGLAGIPKIGFPAQIQELEQLAAKVNAQKGVEFVPFLCVDPRGHTANDLLKLVTGRCGKGKPCSGVKLYPPMGILPSDPRLQSVFDFCQDRGIPVLTHCSAGGAGVRGSTHNYADNAHPAEWRKVLERLEGRWKGQGKIRICLAHFDGLYEPDDISWSVELIDMMRQYDGSKGVELYADISFNVIPENNDARARYELNVKKVKDLGIDDRVIFGSDWWMYLYVCAGEAAFIEQLHLEQNNSWFAKDMDAAADRFLADVL